MCMWNAIVQRLMEIGGSGCPQLLTPMTWCVVRMECIKYQERQELDMILWISVPNLHDCLLDREKYHGQRVFDENVHMNRHRVIARGNATFFSLLWRTYCNSFKKTSEILNILERLYTVLWMYCWRPLMRRYKRVDDQIYPLGDGSSKHRYSTHPERSGAWPGFSATL